MRMIPLALGVWMAATASAQESSPPGPLPGNSVAFPDEARQAGVVGDVVFTAQVDETGGVTGVSIRDVPMAGYGFEEKVSQAVRAWRFRPALADGRPVAGVYQGRVHFQLRPEDEAGLRTLGSRLAALWNARDAEGVAALFDTELALVRPAKGGNVKGTKAVAEWIQEQLAGAPLRLSETPKGIRFLAADAAFVVFPRPEPTESAPAARPWAVMAAKRGDLWRVARFDAGAGDPEPLRVGGDIKEPSKVKDVPPRYPDAMKQARVQGVVILECVIGADGRVQNVRVMRGIPLLNEAAVEAVRQWVYAPTILEGQAVPVVMTVTVNFRLR